MMQKAQKLSDFLILGLESKGAKFGLATLLHAYWPVICQILVNLCEFCSFSFAKDGRILRFFLPFLCCLDMNDLYRFEFCACK